MIVKPSHTLLFILLALVLVVDRLGAHHSFAPVYDAKRTITVQGVVTEFRLINPHALMLMEVTDDTGKVVTWTVEFAGRLNLFAVGEENAAALGVDVERSKRIVFLASSLLTGAAVAFAGIIGFVGLLVPHAVRAAVGNDQRTLFPVSAIAGAALLVAADAVSRAAFAPAELPVGAVTAAIGAPVFAWLLLRNP